MQLLAKKDGFARLPIFALLAFASLGMLTVAGCKSSTDQNAQSTDAQTTDAAASSANPQDPNDPANTNLAPIPASYSPAPTSGSSGGSSSASAAPDSGSYGSQSGGEYSEANYTPDANEYASEPPPALPQYDQPPIPAPGYIWTPGYWAWGQQGYYWVPGAWTEPPYQGALGVR